MVDTTDILNKDDIRALAENISEENSYFRQAFRSLDGSDAGGSMSFPQIDEEDEIQEADIEEIPESAEYPTADFNYSAQTLYFSKWGVGLTFTDESVSDSRLGVVIDGQKNLLQASARKMDTLAHNVLTGAAQASGQGDGAGNLSISELIDARAWMKTEEGGRTKPDMALVEPLGASSILKEMTEKQTSMGDDATRNGEIGRIADMTIIEADTGHLSPHEAVLVDSQNLGFEVPKYQREVERVRKAMADKTLMKVSSRLGWIATDKTQAATVEG